MRQMVVVAFTCYAWLETMQPRSVIMCWFIIGLYQTNWPFHVTTTKKWNKLSEMFLV